MGAGGGELVRRGISSNGRAIVYHGRHSGIGACILHDFFSFSEPLCGRSNST